MLHGMTVQSKWLCWLYPRSSSPYCKILYQNGKRTPQVGMKANGKYNLLCPREVAESAVYWVNTLKSPRYLRQSMALLAWYVLRAHDINVKHRIYRDDLVMYQDNTAGRNEVWVKYVFTKRKNKMKSTIPGYAVLTLIYLVNFVHDLHAN